MESKRRGKRQQRKPPKGILRGLHARMNKIRRQNRCAGGTTK